MQTADKGTGNSEMRRTGGNSGTLLRRLAGVFTEPATESVKYDMRGFTHNMQRILGLEVQISGSGSIARPALFTGRVRGSFTLRETVRGSVAADLDDGSNHPIEAVRDGKSQFMSPGAEFSVRMPPLLGEAAEITYDPAQTLSRRAWYLGIHEAAVTYLVKLALQHGARKVVVRNLPDGIAWHSFTGPEGEFIGTRVSVRYSEYGQRWDSASGRYVANAYPNVRDWGEARPGQFEHVEFSEEDLPKMEHFLLRDRDGNPVRLGHGG